MKAETKLNKILSMEDNYMKLSKLFQFSCEVLPYCQLWETANKEWERLWDLGFRLQR